MFKNVYYITLPRMEMLIKVSITLRNQCTYQKATVNPDLLTFTSIDKFKIYPRSSQGCLTDKPLSVPTSHYQIGPDIPINSLPKKLEYDEFINYKLLSKILLLKLFKILRGSVLKIRKIIQMTHSDKKYLRLFKSAKSSLN